jgi:hypothetical protein
MEFPAGFLLKKSVSVRVVAALPLAKPKYILYAKNLPSAVRLLKNVFFAVNVWRVV